VALSIYNCHKTPGKSYIKGTFRLENGRKSTLVAVNLLSECGLGIMATALSRAFRQCAGQSASGDICMDACCLSTRDTKQLNKRLSHNATIASHN